MVTAKAHAKILQVSPLTNPPVVTFILSLLLLRNRGQKLLSEIHHQNKI